MWRCGKELEMRKKVKRQETEKGMKKYWNIGGKRTIESGLGMSEETCSLGGRGMAVS